jgi:hypothetical protein
LKGKVGSSFYRGCHRFVSRHALPKTVAEYRLEWVVGRARNLLQATIGNWSLRRRADAFNIKALSPNNLSDSLLRGTFCRNSPAIAADKNRLLDKPECLYLK